MDKEEELVRWKEDVYMRTQGHVDVDARHPKLGRYLGPGFFKDTEWWNTARMLLSPEQNNEINRRFDNLFSPQVILFADKSPKSREFFDLLMDGDISLRVLPLDEYINEPIVGRIIFDVLYKERDQIERFISANKKFIEVWDEEQESGRIPKADPNFADLISKIRQIQIERAIVEMSRIQRS